MKEPNTGIKRSWVKPRYCLKLWILLITRHKIKASPVFYLLSSCLESSTLTTLSQAPVLHPQSGFFAYWWIDNSFLVQTLLFSDMLSSWKHTAGISLWYKKTYPVSLYSPLYTRPLSLSLVSQNYDRGFDFVAI